MRLAGYLRVSTEGQVDAYGKDVQDDSIRRWAALNGHEIVEPMFEEDAVSGKVDGGDRPVLASVLLRADEFDGIVFFDATRIARRLFVQETLLALVWGTGLRVFTTTAGEIDRDDDDPTRILIRQVLGAVAEFDHRSTVKKLHAARRRKAADGGFAGGTPRFGVRVEGVGKTSQLVADEAELQVVGLIKSMHADGTGVRQIAAALNRLQIPTKTGKVWDVTGKQVQRIIQRYENT